MRIYTQLRLSEQERAVKQATESLLLAIMNGSVYFTTNNRKDCDDLQTRIDIAHTKANGLRTPWFWGEYIMDTCEKEIKEMAKVDAEDALYPDPTERIIYLT